MFRPLLLLASVSGLLQAPRANAAAAVDSNPAARDNDGSNAYLLASAVQRLQRLEEELGVEKQQWQREKERWEEERQQWGQEMLQREGEDQDWQRFKQDMLGVSAQTLQRHGAVSEQTVSEMLAGALSGLQRKAVAVAVSGIAGPGGGSLEKPVGTVFIGWMTTGGQPRIQRFRFEGDRRLVRMQSVLEALRGLTGE